ncbi:hypothetical protein LTR08_003781 [Meristemomyces frigidus]|nr:hypothetical protein LTR08_003781 [Meristemomyces frigidus]
MAQDVHGQMVFINYLLEEKDRLIREKDELLESKDKLWRAMHQTIRKRDASIHELEHQLRVGAREAFMQLGVPDAVQGKDTNNLLASREENDQLHKRNQLLDEALRVILDRNDEAEEEEEEEEEQDDVMEEVAAIKRERRDGGDSTSTFSAPDDVAFGRRFDPAPAPLQVSLPSPDSDVLSVRTATLPTFSFAPLITMSDAGMHQTGKIEMVALTVIQSIRFQLAILQSRVEAGKSPAVPTARKTDATWEDADYYIIHQGTQLKSENLPGVWADSKKWGKRRKIES